MLGILGGTGLYRLEDLQSPEDQEIKTPYGPPSALVRTGKWGNRKVAFLPRHGIRHEILPSEINSRANIWALKKIGVKQVLSVSATGSLSPELGPGEIALVNQYIDFTKCGRARSFFGDGLVGHISTAAPTCARLETQMGLVAESVGVLLKKKKTYVCVEGPRLGTKAESSLFQKMGADLIGMTNLPEAFLAREAQMCYLPLAIVTDFDCWQEDPSQHVSADKVMEIYSKSVDKVIAILRAFCGVESSPSGCACRQALKGAVLTAETALPYEKRQLLDILRS